MNMENYSLPLRASWWKALEGTKFVAVERQLFKNDVDWYGPLTADEESDGPIQFRCANGEVFHIISWTETYSLLIAMGPMPKYGSSFVHKDVSMNHFWSTRLEKRVTGCEVLKSLYANEDYPSEFGIVLQLEDHAGVVIEYLSEEEYPDQMRISGEYTGPVCHHIKLF